MIDRNQHLAAAEGRRRRDKGMSLAAMNRRRLIVADQLLLLRVMLLSSDLTATLDDVVGWDRMFGKYADGGRWRGSVPQGLARAGLIVPNGFAVSHRVSRHRGYLRRWRGVDRTAIEAEVVRLQAWLVATAPKDEERSDAETSAALSP
jgi:hypothetical protein